MTNLRQFNNRLRRATKDFPAKEMKRVQKKLAVEALRRIVMKTPVDTGRARGNWQLTIDDPAVLEKYSDRPIEEGMATLKTLGIFQVVFITNNVPYIVYLEKGSSSQAPNGMVEITLQELLNAVS